MAQLMTGPISGIPDACGRSDAGGVFPFPGPALIQAKAGDKPGIAAARSGVCLAPYDAATPCGEARKADRISAWDRRAPAILMTARMRATASPGRTASAKKSSSFVLS